MRLDHSWESRYKNERTCHTMDDWGKISFTLFRILPGITIQYILDYTKAQTFGRHVEWIAAVGVVVVQQFGCICTFLDFQYIVRTIMYCTVAFFWRLQFSWQNYETRRNKVTNFSLDWIQWALGIVYVIKINKNRNFYVQPHLKHIIQYWGCSFFMHETCIFMGKHFCVT